MTQRERIARFERLGLGLFVHFGVFFRAGGRGVASGRVEGERGRICAVSGPLFPKEGLGGGHCGLFIRKFSKQKVSKKCRARFMPGPAFHDTITERTR